MGYICGVGTYTPTNTPTITNTPTNTSTPTPTFTPSNTPIFSLTPSLTPRPGEVIISEVAWMGTQASSDDEWIELYNTRSIPINLTNWRLVSDSGGLDIVLSGEIPANGFFLLERAYNNVVSDVVANQTYIGTLSDTGETLRLRMPNGTIVDTANANGGVWPAGTGSPNFSSMERVVTGGIPAADTDTGWVSNTNSVTWTRHDAANNLIHGTPAGINWGFSVTATAFPTATATPTRTPTGTATLSPTPAGFLSALINEVAWMGTGASTSDEWIELYNPGSISIDLEGWLLRADDSTPNIVFPAGKSIPPGGYFLLERTDETTVVNDNLAISNKLIFTGELSNSFEVLRLYDASGRLIDTANANGGAWPAGTISPIGSMERRGVVADSDTAWITNVNSASWTKHDARCTTTPCPSTYLVRGTPGYANWAASVTPTPSPRPTATRQATPTRTLTPPPPPPLIAINEFVPRPGTDWNNDGVINTGDEYIELINHGVVSVNLSGYTLDDEVNVGSTPYRLPSVTLQPGERIVYYGSQTGLLLGDGGDGVRLLKPNGQLADAYNYSVVRFPDQSYCRLPDNGGLDDWNQNCRPTPGLPNQPAGSSLPPAGGAGNEALCPISDTLPADFALAECPSFGNIWSRWYWDRDGWFGEMFIPNLDGQWEVFVD